MIDTKFKDRIEKRLNYLRSYEIMEFTWRCAIRTLPFIGYHGNFDFWKKKEIQSHLYNILHSLDLCIYNAKFNNREFMLSFNHSQTLIDSSIACENSAIAILQSKVNMAEIICTTAYAATNSTDICLQVRDSNFESALYAAADLDFAAEKLGIRIRKEILKDISDIKYGRKTVGIIPQEYYGNIWTSFSKAMKKEKNHFWLSLYGTILKNGFETDYNDIKKRINILKNIKLEGAAKVALQIKKDEIQSARLNESRIILLGEKGAGKTCLARRLKDLNAPMTTEDESTPGVDTSIWGHYDKNINIHIWDFAGHTVTHAVHRFFLSSRCLYIIVYDGRSEERNRIIYWLDHIKNYGGDSKVLIVINKRDKHCPNIPINSLKERYPILDIVTFSIKNDIEKLDEFRSFIVEYIGKNSSWSRVRIPIEYFKVKADLEIAFGQRLNETLTDCITKDQFIDIANKYKIEDKDALLSNLNSLGITLWYKDMPQYNTLILNPEWISYGVYRIINWVSNRKEHSIKITDFEYVFQNPVDSIRYPKDKHNFLFDLIKHYELAFESNDRHELIIPHLLSEDRPVSLPLFGIDDSLMIRYKSEQPLPPNTISRFIVRHSNEIKNNIVWRLGVVLEDNKGNIALIREIDRSISVSVKGTNKREYISILRATLNDIFESYKSDKPELQYRIQRYGEITTYLDENNPLWLPDHKIYNHNSASIPYYDDITNKQIILENTVNNYNITTDSFIKDGNIEQLSIKKEVNNFNLNDCNINLQSHLNELSQLIQETGFNDQAQSLSSVANILEQAETYTKPEEFKKKGIANRLRRIIDELSDDKSTLNKTVKGLKNGINIAQELAVEYNKLADWLLLPQVPKILLKKEKKE